MATELSRPGKSLFVKIKQTDENNHEFWRARVMAKVLEYSEYRHFIPVLERAKEACKNSGQEITHHFEDVLEMLDLGKGAQRKVESVKLSHYACYLIVQNAAPSKEVVALGQTYFVPRKVNVQWTRNNKQINSMFEKKPHIWNL
ncbi:MAG: hypothetical protein MUF68_02915 [Cyclobacteriaceae bacterium]|nr:hypothetical protein [Cyclobacteriaceae bacterium]